MDQLEGGAEGTPLSQSQSTQLFHGMATHHREKAVVGVTLMESLVNYVVMSPSRVSWHGQPFCRHEVEDKRQTTVKSSFTSL